MTTANWEEEEEEGGWKKKGHCNMQYTCSPWQAEDKWPSKEKRVLPAWPLHVISS